MRQFRKDSSYFGACYTLQMQSKFLFQIISLDSRKYNLMLRSSKTSICNNLFKLWFVTAQGVQEKAMIPVVFYHWYLVCKIHRIKIKPVDIDQRMNRTSCMFEPQTFVMLSDQIEKHKLVFYLLDKTPIKHETP